MNKDTSNSKFLKSILVSVAFFALLMTISVLRKPVAGGNSSHGGMRIISLAPNITEMLFVLGVEDSLRQN